jgi:hypothetical protein
MKKKVLGTFSLSSLQIKKQKISRRQQAITERKFMIKISFSIGEEAELLFAFYRKRFIIKNHVRSRRNFSV